MHKSILNIIFRETAAVTGFALLKLFGSFWFIERILNKLGIRMWVRSFVALFSNKFLIVREISDDKNWVYYILIYLGFILSYGYIISTISYLHHFALSLYAYFFTPNLTSFPRIQNKGNTSHFWKPYSNKTLSISLPMITHSILFFWMCPNWIWPDFRF